MKKRGPKGKYETLVKPYLEEINKKVRQGVIEEEIAKSLNISVATLNNYKKDYPELKEALSKNKGADVLQSLINAGVQAAIGYYKENETTTIVLGSKVDEKGNPIAEKKQKVVNRVWYKPDATLNRFYVLNFGKEEGFSNDPLDYEMKKAKADFEAEEQKKDNWFK